MARDQDTSLPSSSILFAAAMARLRRGGAAAGRAALAGGVMLQLPTMIGCVDAEEVSSTEQADWAQFEGVRDAAMIGYTGGYWSECRAPNTRFGCGSIDLYLKVRVRPVVGADLAWKRVGVVYKTPSDTSERTAIGRYFTTYGNGDEEWHVPVNVPTWQTTVLFDAWYQDGADTTWIDDNQGELHVVNDGPSYNIVRAEPWLGTVTIGDGGVNGRISIQASDLDFDKQIALVGTTDGWATQFELGLGQSGDQNRWYWVEDFAWSPGRERWQIDLALSGEADTFEYAIVYRHGVVNGARTYEFWDNNFGSNYRVERGPQLEN